MAKVTVVTPDRFKQGFSYKDWIAQIKVNKERFEDWYNKFQVSSSDSKALKDLMARKGGPVKVLAIGEDWCPDVIRGMPVIARIAEATSLDLKVFPRDQHLDIMDEFLKDGQFRSIPTFVFYDKDMNYIAHWIERPALANKESAEITAAVNKELDGRPDPEKAAERRKRTESRWAAWQQETVNEIKDLLAKHVK